MMYLITNTVIENKCFISIRFGCTTLIQSNNAQTKYRQLNNFLYVISEKDISTELLVKLFVGTN